MKISAFIGVALLISATTYGSGWTEPPYPSGRAEIEAINQKIEGFYLSGDFRSLVELYDKNPTYLAEFRPVIYETDDLRQFYKDWFSSVRVRSYHKNIYEVEPIAGYLLEVGTFSLTYAVGSQPQKLFTGKYMIMWKKETTGQWKILSEAFGADHHVKPEGAPYAAVIVPDRRPLQKNLVSSKLLPEITAFDQGAVKAVLAGDGQSRADEFTQDGIYLPHYDSMRIGMAMIRPYMLRIYTPGGDFSDVQDTYREIFDTGEYVFMSGHFKVFSERDGKKSSFEGNMSCLMKRGKDGKLLMYRQLAHD